MVIAQDFFLSLSDNLDFFSEVIARVIKGVRGDSLEQKWSQLMALNDYFFEVCHDKRLRDLCKISKLMILIE